jgi:hypothetical protein
VRESRRGQVGFDVEHTDQLCLAGSAADRGPSHKPGSDVFVRQEASSEITRCSVRMTYCSIDSGSSEGTNSPSSQRVSGACPEEARHGASLPDVLSAGVRRGLVDT